MNKEETVKGGLSTSRNNLITYLVVGVVIFFVLFVRLRLLSVPLERDEGEYAYMGQLLLQGILPYTEAYNMKLPGIYFVYALILAIFGQTHTGIHLALIFANIATSILLFLLCRRLFNNVICIITAISFLIIMLSPSVQGFWANSEHFVILAAVGGILLMLRALEKHSIIILSLSGVLFGITFLIKQHGIFFTIFGFIYLCFLYLGKRPIILKEAFLYLGLFVLGIIIPFGLTAILFLTSGSFDNFWFWTFKYAYKYASVIPISVGINNFRWAFAEIIKPVSIILIVTLIGLISPFWNKLARSRLFFVYGFFIASFLTICPGLYFRPHYFILLVPAISLLTGIGVNSITEKISSSYTRVIVTSCIAFGSLAYPIVNQREFLFSLSPEEACRAVYGLNPFPESIKIAEYINNNTNENDRIAVLGSEPQIYFYSKRRSSTGYIYMYALMEPHEFAAQMQREMISEIETSDPKYIVLINASTSWLMRPDSDKLLINWINNYVSNKYELCGLVDFVSNYSIVYRWGDEVRNYSPRSSINTFIFKRKALKHP